MSNLWLEIESLVLDGVPMDAAKGRRFGRLTEMALERLLRDRGTSATLAASEPKDADAVKAGQMKLPAGANENQWAEQLALVLYRAVDRMV